MQYTHLLSLRLIAVSLALLSGCDDEPSNTTPTAGVNGDAGTDAGVGGDAGASVSGTDAGVGGDAGASVSGTGMVPLPIINLTAPVLALPSRVRPGEVLSVQVVVTNDGAEPLTADYGVEALLTSESAPPEDWPSATLALAAEAAPGAVATFSAELTAPSRTGYYRLEWQLTQGGALIGEPVSGWVDVTCSDGVFCNGVERFAGGRCVEGPAPCDDGEECTADECHEETGACSFTPSGPECASCRSEECTPDCAGKQCGDDGCGGVCGACGEGQGCASVMGICQPADIPGSCQAPLPLLAEGVSLIGDHVIEGDSSGGLHQAVPTCNSTSAAVETVYTFTTTERVGIDARSYRYDTVLHLRREDAATPGSDCLNDDPAATVGCSDDASPPGDYGSRFATTLEPGTYYLIVDGFDSTQYGPYTLDVRFRADGCVPQCDGRYCGDDDGCGGACGACGEGEVCGDDFRCHADPCVPSCEGMECGDDGCGGSCGECQSGELCVPATATCQAFESCDHFRPTCAEGCPDDMFCGTDCACHAVGAPMPDLTLNAARAQRELLFDTVTVDPASCSWVEQCVNGTGVRQIVRFSVEAINQGQETLYVDPPDTRPDQFSFSPCHRHYHFGGFATYALRDAAGEVVVYGRKQAYCMEDTVQVIEGPNVGCNKVYSCEEQGIQAGWSDLYGNQLDCQWLDITDVPSGDYTLEVSVNPNRAFEEMSQENNTILVPLSIP